MLRVTLPRRLRCRTDGRIGTSLPQILSMPHNEHCKIDLLWAGHSYRLDWHTSLGRPCRFSFVGSDRSLSN
jgi:hypothetical protein